VRIVGAHLAPGCAAGCGGFNHELATDHLHPFVHVDVPFHIGSQGSGVMAAKQGQIEIETP
jgi:hypothetical protein